MIFSTLWAGGVVAPMNPLSTNDELVVQLRAAGAKAVATHPSMYAKVVGAAEQAGIPASRVLLLEDDISSRGRPSLKSLARHRSKTRRPQLDSSNDLAFLVFSSGTTGLPKGVMLSHTNIVANIIQVAVMDQEHTTWQRDRVLGFLPMYHIYGKTTYD
jgi:4-coumarate--CoA ligase